MSWADIYRANIVEFPSLPGRCECDEPLPDADLGRCVNCGKAIIPDPDRTHPGW